MNNDTKEYYSQLTTASNKINITEGTNVDHTTITGFMDWEAKQVHLKRIQEIADSLK